MPLRDVLYLLVKPFLGRQSGETQAELLSRSIEEDSAAQAARDPGAAGTARTP